ncbi:hypothetical protein KIN20_037495 [Parelaphostrongylus tenuis]|uniref:Uncharacterized protein n=1 Tax=Parelaphostrongylus tenuis TaxID=148309 RepID=A0AAD5WM51_PARTN|nr:hypothetical protein KIN20_037495 [Parelaphostrongylus tenuis]
MAQEQLDSAPSHRSSRGEEKANCANSFIVITDDRSMPIRWDLLLAGQTINAKRYCQHLERRNQAIPRHRCR